MNFGKILLPIAGLVIEFQILLAEKLVDTYHKNKRNKETPPGLLEKIVAINFSKDRIIDLNQEQTIIHVKFM